MTYEEKLKSIDELAERGIMSSSTNTISISDGSTLGVHTHPAISFSTGSDTLDKIVEEAISSNPYDLKLLKQSVQDIRTSDTFDQIETEMRNSIESSYSTSKSMTEDVESLEKDWEFLESVRVHGEDTQVENLVDILKEKPAWRFNFDPITGRKLEPREQLSVWNEYFKQEINGFKTRISETQMLESKIAQRPEKILETIQNGGTERDLFFTAVDPGVVKPSTADIKSMLNKKQVIQLGDGSQIKVDKVVYPNGVAYYCHEMGSDVVHVITSNGKEFTRTELPVSRFLGE